MRLAAMFLKFFISVNASAIVLWRLSSVPRLSPGVAVRVSMSAIFMA